MSAIVLSEKRRTSTGRSNNWWALVLVIVAETMFFGSLISAYVFLRAQSINWLPTGAINLDPLLPALNTVILLASSLAVHQASTAARRGESLRLQRWLPVAAALGIVIGLGLMTVAFVKSRRSQMTRTRHFAITAASAYWHFLDAVWIVLFALLYWL
jgi:cytochrome c oxidase subunit 3